MSKHWMKPQQWSQNWKAFSVVMAAGFVGLLSVSIVNVALPAIESSLHATPTQFQWIVAGYAVAFGLLLVPSGRLGDVVGRRPVFLIGSLLFMLTSLACGLSTTAEILVIMRVLQGIGASITTPQVIGFIQELFQGRERARAFGIFGMVVSISSAIGPALGGILVSGLGPEWGWRSVFLVNIPFSIFILVMGPKLLPAPQKREKGTKLNLDTVGLVLMAAGVLASMLPFILATDPAYGVENSPWYLIGVGVAFGALFTAWELWRESHQHAVVMPRALMKNAGFTLGSAVSTGFFAGWTGVFIVLTLYLQQGLGMAAWLAGLIQVPLALLGAYGSQRSSVWMAMSGRWLVFIGLVVTMAGLGLMAVSAIVLSEDFAWLGIVIAGAIAGFGSGITISPNQTFALAEVPVTQAGAAGGVLQTVQRVGSAVGIAGVTLVFFATRFDTSLEGYAHAFAISMAFIIALMAIGAICALADALRNDGREELLEMEAPQPVKEPEMPEVLERAVESQPLVMPKNLAAAQALEEPQRLGETQSLAES